MKEKEFKTTEEQIELLKSRGLTVNDYQASKSFLLRNNYYRVSGYSLTLRNHDVFYAGVSFQNIVDIYQFDHEMRHILLKYLEIIETAVKSVFAYEFSKSYTSLGYLDSSLFCDYATYEK